MTTIVSTILQQQLQSYGLSESDIEKLQLWGDLLFRWQKKMNLVAPSTLQHLWQRHMLDAAQLLPLCETDAQTTHADFGSGAGFPGLMVGLVNKGQTYLIEANQKKAIFLTEAIRIMGLNHKVAVVCSRIEQLPKQYFNLVTARALASLEQLFTLAYPFINERTIFVLPKGKAWQTELQQCNTNWQFQYIMHPSITEEDAVILTFTQLHQA